MNNEVVVFTDGGCSGNPGPGAWGAIVIADGTTRQYSGSAADTTNNRMELTAAIEALSAVKKIPEFTGRPVILNIDSQYVKGGITDWIQKWKTRNWKNSERKPVKNKDLWETLDALNASMLVKWNWVKGHSGIVYNEMCDQLCREELEKLAAQNNPQN